LIATSETPNRTPAAVASSSASRRCSTSRRVEILTSATPTARIALSNAISAAREERCGPSEVAVRPITASLMAVSVKATPLMSSKVESEEALREYGEENEAAEEDCLHG